MIRTSKRIILMAVCLAVTLSGCGRIRISLFPDSVGSSQEETTSVVTQEPQPTEVPAEVTVTPMPTSTPAPRRIGTKTSTAKYIYLTNNLSNALREIYLKENGSSDWGKNLIPSESSVKSAETAQMFYSISTEQYDLKVVDKSGNSYALYYVSLDDMESGILRADSSGTVYIYYTSLSSGQQEQNGYSEVLALNYSDSQYYYDDSYDSSDDWEVYYYDDGSSYDNSGTYGPTEGFYIEDYDPMKDYSEFEGNYNYGYYDNYGNWISYY